MQLKINYFCFHLPEKESSGSEQVVIGFQLVAVAVVPVCLGDYGTRGSI